MDAVDDTVSFIEAFEPMVEALVDAGVTFPLSAVGSVLLMTAANGELVRERALATFAALGELDGESADAAAVASDREAVAVAREMVIKAVDRADRAYERACVAAGLPGAAPRAGGGGGS
jgi:hypothetical protein